MTKRKTQFRASYLVGIAIVIAVLVGVNVLGRVRYARLDLTNEGMYTVSPAMRGLLTGLADEVKVTYYVSKGLPELRDLRRETLDRFQDFERAAGGTFKYEIVDVPSDILDEERRKADPSLERLFATLQAERIEPVSASVRRAAGQEEALVFSTITVAYLDNPKVSIHSYVSPTALEYNLAKILVRLSQKSRPVIAFFDGKPTFTETPATSLTVPATRQHEFSILVQFLNQTFDVREIALSETSPIPDETGCLIVAQPSKLNERQKCEINRHVSAGGDAIFLVSEYAVDTEAGKLPFPMEANEPNLNDLFAAWGFTIGPQLVADSQTSIRVPKMVQVGGRLRAEQQWMPMFLYLTGEQLDQHSPLTARLNGLYFRNATPIVLDEATLRDNGIEAQVLAETSPDSWYLPAAGMPFLSPFLFREPRKEEMEGPQKLVVLLHGTFPFRYAGQPVPEWPRAELDEAAPPGVPEAGAAPDEPTPTLAPPLELRPTTVLVVSTAELIKITNTDIYGTPEWTDERLNFLENAVETLARGQDLLTIRAKTLTARPFEHSSRARLTIYTVINLATVPVLVVVVGFGRYVVRRRSRRVYQERKPS